MVALERLRGARHYFRKTPGIAGFKAYEYVAYRHPSVARALAEMFEDKCAYCETSVAGTGTARIEHFRPKGGALDVPDHPGYWWLAHDWENLLPSCASCNEGRRFAVLTEMVSLEEFKRLLRRRAERSVGKMNHFPIAGVRAMTRKGDLSAEDPLLIDPARRDPTNHLTWRLDGEQSLVEARPVPGGRCPRGAESIRTFALNRVLLVKERTQLLNELRYQREQILEDLRVGMDDPSQTEQAVANAKRRASQLRRFALPDRPYTALATAFVDAFEKELLSIDVGRS
ncbi:hypothetical protein [Sphingomonas panni]|uniref:hypothetical protein n=1 Tax=Sphingomonas panni TaxID=237612 RepID=UPI001F5B72F6|nr:hypothetical protein [Sphingomonas panni]